MFASQKTFISPKSVKALKETWEKPPAGVTNKPFSFIAKTLEGMSATFFTLPL